MKKLSVAIIALVSAVLAGLIYLYAVTKMQGYNPSRSERLITYHIGGEAFSIPRNYIWSGVNPKSKHISMETLYPTMEGRTEQNEFEFDKLGWGTNVRFSLIEANKNNLAEHAFDLVIDKAESYSYSNYAFERKINGLSLYKEAGSFDKYLFESAAVGEKWRVFTCSEEDSAHPVPSPSCSTRFNLTDKIEINYSFSKEYLFEWQKLEASLIKLILSFKKHSPLQQQNEITGFK